VPIEIAEKCLDTLLEIAQLEST